MFGMNAKLQRTDERSHQFAFSARSMDLLRPVEEYKTASTVKGMKDLKKGIIIAFAGAERNITLNQGEKQSKPSKNRRDPEEKLLLDRESSLRALHILHGRCH